MIQKAANYWIEMSSIYPRTCPVLFGVIADPDLVHGFPGQFGADVGYREGEHRGSGGLGIENVEQRPSTLLSPALPPLPRCNLSKPTSRVFPIHQLDPRGENVFPADIVVVKMPPMATTKTSTTRSGERALRWVVLLAAAFVVTQPACSEPATSPTGIGGADAGLAATGGSARNRGGPGGGGHPTRGPRVTGTT